MPLTPRQAAVAGGLTIPAPPVAVYNGQISALPGNFVLPFAAKSVFLMMWWDLNNVNDTLQLSFYKTGDAHDAAHLQGRVQSLVHSSGAVNDVRGSCGMWCAVNAANSLDVDNLSLVTADPITIICTAYQT